MGRRKIELIKIKKAEMQLIFYILDYIQKKIKDLTILTQVFVSINIKRTNGKRINFKIKIRLNKLWHFIQKIMRKKFYQLANLYE